MRPTLRWPSGDWNRVWHCSALWWRCYGRAAILHARVDKKKSKKRNKKKKKGKKGNQPDGEEDEAELNLAAEEAQAAAEAQKKKDLYELKRLHEYHIPSADATKVDDTGQWIK